MVDVATRSPARLHLDELRFIVFGRLVPAVAFALLGYFVLTKLVAQVHMVSAQASFARVMEAPLPTALYLCFCAIPVGIYLVRPRPHARDGRMVARASGFVGTLMLLGVGALPVPFTFHLPLAARIIATPMAILAFSTELFGLAHLRRNLSIIPEARRLVTSGPYRFVRHPLYLGEVLAAVAAVLANPGLWAAVSIPPFVGVQLLRAHFEEQLLARSFPQYADYSRRTRRLIPLVW